MYAFQQWKRWASQRSEVKVFPVQEVHFALYLQHLGEVAKSKSAVEDAVNAISWVHQISGLPAISGSMFVRATLTGLQRRLAKPKVRKEPVAVNMISALVDSFGPCPALSDVCLAATVLLSFAAFLRYDEIAKLCCRDINFAADHMSVHIQSSKTDQYRQGDSVLVARTGSKTCPVSMLEQYYRMGGILQSSSLSLFRGITKTKQGSVSALRAHLAIPICVSYF